MYFFNDPTEYDDQLISKHCNENTSDHMTLLESSMTSLEDWNQVSVNNSLNKELLSQSDLVTIKDIKSQHEIMMESNEIRQVAWQAIDDFLNS